MGRHVVIIGAGLAGSEAAWQLAERGVPVVLYEQRPGRPTAAHRTDHCAELVCSNTLRSNEPTSAIGCLKEEMRVLDSLIIGVADAHRVPAGKALAVDREGFSRAITDRITMHPNVTVIREEVPSLTGDWRRATSNAAAAVVVATGPLTADALAREILAMTQTNALYFYDSLAPLVAAETIDVTQTFRAARYGVGEGDDYINCPMDRALYEAFVVELIKAEKVPVHDFEDPKYFEGCLPIEVMAERGMDTLRHGPMKPMGLTDPRAGKIPHAVVQLRQDNREGTVYNIVGFQTRMKWTAQQRIFRMIPGLAEVEFLRLGAMHRNTYINSPLLLDTSLQLKTTLPDTGATIPIYFAGQITGVEGYVESAAMGLWVGLVLHRKLSVVGRQCGKFAGDRRLATGDAVLIPPPQTTALGSLIHHVAHGNPHRFEPMNAHWGLTPAVPLSIVYNERKGAYLARARADFAAWLGADASHNSLVAKPSGFSIEGTHARSARDL